MENKAESNKIVILDNQTTKNEHLTLKAYGQGIKHFKYWVVGITIGCGILGFLGSQFIINPAREVMTTNIEIDLALNENKNSYLDGKSFFYSNIISRENINGVISSNEKFKNYDASKILKDSLLSIAPKVVDGVESKTAYTITCKPKAFKSTDECKAFLKALLDYEVKKAQDATSSFSYKNMLPSNSSTLFSMEFNDIVSTYQSQYDYLVSAYQNMAKTFNSYFIVKGDSISNHYYEFINKYETLNWNELKGDFYTSKYVNVSSLQECPAKINVYKNLKATYEVEFKTIQADIDRDNSLLTSLCSIRQPDTSVSERILSLTDEISSLETKKQKMITNLADIGYDVSETTTGFVISENYETNENTYIYKLNHADQEYVDNCIKFKNSLSNIYNALNESTNLATELYQECYKTSDNNNIYVLDADMGTISGHISNMLIAGALLVVGFLLSSFIFAEIDINRNGTKKEENSKGTEEIKAKS